MSMFREMFSGYAQRIRLENSLQLQRAKTVRPSQIRLQCSTVLKQINDELKDPELKAVWDSINIVVPE